MAQFRLSSLGPALLLVAIGAGIYANSLRTPFLFDDEPNIVDEPRIRHLWPPDWLSVNPLRPVVYFTFAANYAAGGTDIMGYHLVNVVIHIAAALSLFGLVRRSLLKLTTTAGTATNLALATTAIWMVHPLTTECVTYTVHRGESIAALCYLTCLYCLVRGADASKAWPWYLASVIAFWIGLGTKEVMATAPFVVVIYDRIFLAKSWREVGAKRKWVYVGMALSAIWFVPRLMPALFQQQSAAGFGVPGITPLEYAKSQPAVVLHYLRLAIWPQPQSIDYGWPVATTVAEVAIPAALVGIMGILALWSLRKRPVWGFAAVAFFVILAPTSSVVPIADLAAERRMYLPLACIVVLVVGGVAAGMRVVGQRFHWLAKPQVIFAGGAFIVIVAVFSWLTVARNELYADPVLMWSDVVRLTPNNARAHYNLGVCLGRNGRHGVAIEHYRKALELLPDYVEAMNNLGLALNEGGQFDEAAALFRRATDCRPKFAEAHANLGNDLIRRGEFEAARLEFEKALTLLPPGSRMTSHVKQTLRELPRVIDFNSTVAPPSGAASELPGALPSGLPGVLPGFDR